MGLEHFCDRLGQVRGHTNRNCGALMLLKSVGLTSRCAKLFEGFVELRPGNRKCLLKCAALRDTSWDIYCATGTGVTRSRQANVELSVVSDRRFVQLSRCWAWGREDVMLSFVVDCGRARLGQVAFEVRDAVVRLFQRLRQGRDSFHRRQVGRFRDALSICMRSVAAREFRKAAVIIGEQSLASRPTVRTVSHRASGLHYLDCVVERGAFGVRSKHFGFESTNFIVRHTRHCHTQMMVTSAGWHNNAVFPAHRCLNSDGVRSQRRRIGSGPCGAKCRGQRAKTFQLFRL
mmetsp:Transcript_20407/g.63425  ORF Transcript_20407/g.63425 Transcript_20407/m.63425 type:complete len:289 (-) Transcript_20407:263-1129(-)